MQGRKGLSQTLFLSLMLTCVRAHSDAYIPLTEHLPTDGFQELFSFLGMAQEFTLPAPATVSHLALNIANEHESTIRSIEIRVTNSVNTVLINAGSVYIDPLTVGMVHFSGFTPVLLAAGTYRLLAWSSDDTEGGNSLYWRGTQPGFPNGGGYNDVYVYDSDSDEFLSSEEGNSRILDAGVSYAYEDTYSDLSFSVGTLGGAAVPEPSGLALTLAFFGAIATFRTLGKKRKKTTT